MAREKKHTIILRVAATLPLFALLLLGVTSLVLLTRDMPAFDRDARVAGLFGDWRVPVQTALYDRSDYLFQIGFGYLQGDVVASSATEARDELASIETALERAAAARAALSESAAIAPGNAYTWGFLGWAHAMEANTAEALTALRISWQLAPQSLQLAISRINLFEVLIDVDEDVLTEPDVLAAAIRDLTLLSQYDRAYFNIAVEGSEVLMRIASDARLLDVR